MSGIRHVGLIPDGGRRWARINGVTLTDAYRKSMSMITGCLDAFYSNEVTSASIYVLSKRNLGRPTSELASFYEAANQFLGGLVPPLTKKHDLEVVIAGNSELIPRELRANIRRLEGMGRGRRRLHLCIAYCPYDELENAVSQLASRERNDEPLSAFWVKEPLDLVIRSGGAVTLSEFLPFQAAYAQLIFLEDLFNDLAITDLVRILHEYSSYSQDVVRKNGGL